MCARVTVPRSLGRENIVDGTTGRLPAGPLSRAKDTARMARSGFSTKGAARLSQILQAF